jgi:hypothetical protein
VNGACEHGNEDTGSVKGWSFSVVAQLVVSREVFSYVELEEKECVLIHTLKK